MNFAFINKHQNIIIAKNYILNIKYEMSNNRVILF